MLDNPKTDALGNTKKLAVAYNMKDLDIRNAMKKSSPSEDVLGFINTKYPNETVYSFCVVLQGPSLQRNDIIEELCVHLHEIDKKADSSNGTKSFFV